MFDAKQPILLLIREPSATLAGRLSELYDVRREPDPEIRIAITSARDGITVAQLDRLPALETVVIHGVGCDKIPLAELSERGIALTTTPDVLTADVADLAIALMLAVVRRVLSNDRFVRDGRWAGGTMPPLATSLTGRRVGILGLGKIGSAIARRAEPFDLAIAYTARQPKPGVTWRFEPDAHALARWAQILIVAVTGGAETVKLVDPAMLDALGPDGVLINISRGSVVDEAALVAALVDGRIAGAGLDVFAHEPAVPEQLLALENVVLQPHQGSATREVRAAMERIVIGNVEAHFHGTPLTGQVL